MTTRLPRSMCACGSSLCAPSTRPSERAAASAAAPTPTSHGAAKGRGCGPTTGARVSNGSELTCMFWTMLSIAFLSAVVGGAGAGAAVLCYHLELHPALGGAFAGMLCAGLTVTVFLSDD